MSADVFHAHLDECKQCSDRPFDLCPVGAILIQAAATGTPFPSFTARRPRPMEFKTLPPRTPFGKEMRDAGLRARGDLSEKFSMPSVDFSSLELRVLAQMEYKFPEHFIRAACEPCTEYPRTEIDHLPVEGGYIEKKTVLNTPEEQEARAKAKAELFHLLYSMESPPRGLKRKIRRKIHQLYGKGTK